MAGLPTFTGDPSRYLVEVSAWLEREATAGKWSEATGDALDEALLGVRDTFIALGEPSSGPESVEFWAFLRFVSALCAARAATGSTQEKLANARASLIARFGEKDPLCQFVDAALASNDLLLVRAAWAAASIWEHQRVGEAAPGPE